MVISQSVRFTWPKHFLKCAQSIQTNKLPENVRKTFYNLNFPVTYRLDDPKQWLEQRLWTVFATKIGSNDADFSIRPPEFKVQ